MFLCVGGEGPPLKPDVVVFIDLFALLKLEQQPQDQQLSVLLNIRIGFM